MLKQDSRVAGAPAQKSGARLFAVRVGVFFRKFLGHSPNKGDERATSRKVRYSRVGRIITQEMIDRAKKPPQTYFDDGPG